MLAGLKVLEISCLHSMLAGQVLADLGADVITVEPPHGAAGRREGPFIQGRLGLNASLTWHSLNRNKRGITLDIDTPDGLAILRELAADADVLIEAAPARAAGALNADALHCVIRPFSHSGPKKDYAFTDTILVAATGAPTYTGYADGAPIIIPVPQAMMEAGAEAAVGILGALAARTRGDGGQRIDVSARVAAMMSAFSLPYFSEANDQPPVRGVGRRFIAGVDIPSIFACRDGFILTSITFGAFAGMTGRLAQWVASCGELPQEVLAIDWTNYPQDVASGKVDTGPLHALIQGLTTAASRLTKDELAGIAQSRRFFAAPLMDMSDVARFEQYAARPLWVETPVADSGTVKAPARFAQFSDFRITHRLPAPDVSEHTLPVLSGLGYTEAEIQALFHHAII